MHDIWQQIHQYHIASQLSTSLCKNKFSSLYIVERNMKVIVEHNYAMDCMKNRHYWYIDHKAA